MLNHNKRNWKQIVTVFLSNDIIDANFEAPKVFTKNDVIANEVILIVKRRLLDIIVRAARQSLTPHQKKIFNKAIKGYSYYEIGEHLDYSKVTTGYSNVWNALHGIKQPDGQVYGGIYKKIRKRVLQVNTVPKLLDMFDAARNSKYDICLEYLQGLDPEFWNDWTTDDDIDEIL